MLACYIAVVNPVRTLLIKEVHSPTTMATRCLAADEEFFESINKHVSLLWNNNKEKVI